MYATLAPYHKDACFFNLCILYLLGPLFNVAMFPSESLWGKVGRFATNRANPESTMIKACSDIAAAHVAALTPWLPIDQKFRSKLPSGADWYAENRVSDSHLAATDGGCKPFVPFGKHLSVCTLMVADIRKLHTFFREYYFGPQHRYNILWGQYTASKAQRPMSRQARPPILRELNGGITYASDDVYFTHMKGFPTWAAEQPNISNEDKRMCRALDGRCTTYKAVIIGNEFKLSVGDLFLARPNAMTDLQRGKSLMWFGQVEQVLRTETPLGKEVMVLKVCTTTQPVHPHPVCCA